MPAYDIEYSSVVMELGHTYYVKMTPFQIIKDNCILNGSSYDGMRQSVRNLLGYVRLAPIPMNIAHDLYVFPTHNPRSDECIWLSLRHIIHISSKKGKKESFVHFSNTKKLPINLSYYRLSRQCHRAYMCRQFYSALSRFNFDDDD